MEMNIDSLKGNLKKKSIFIRNYRYLILILCLLCTTAISANINAFNFTMLCKSSSDNHSAPTSQRTNLWNTKGDFTDDESFILQWSSGWSTLLTALPFNILYSYFGAKRVLTLACFLSAILMAIFPFAANLGIIASGLVRFLQGITYSADFAAMGLISSKWAPLSQNGLFMSVLSTYTPLSSMIANSIAGMLCTSRFGWHMVYYSFAMATLIIALLWAIFYDNPSNSRFLSVKELDEINYGKSEAQIHTKKFIPYKAILKSKLVWIIWFNALVEFCSGAFILMYKPTYFNLVLNFDLNHTGFLTSISAVVHIILKIFFGLISDRITPLNERQKLILFNTIGVGLPMLAYVGIAYAPSPLFALSCFVLHGFFFAAAGAGFFKCASLTSRQYAHFVIGNMQISKCLALFICPTLKKIFVKNITDQSQWRTIFLLFAALSFLANILFCCVATDIPEPFTTINQEGATTT